LDFSKSEQQYLCGNEENLPWSQIPWAQRKFFSLSFLESRGYHASTYEYKDSQLLVSLGPRSYLKSITIRGGPAEFDMDQAREFPGKALTPKLLDEIEAWAIRHLKHGGYPCVTVKSQAIPETETIELTIYTGTKRTIGTIERSAQEYDPGLVKGGSEADELGLDPDTAGRYQVFEPGDAYDGKQIELSERRPAHQGLLLNTYYSYKCADPNAKTPLNLKQTSALATPRTITFGVGINTEGILIAKTSFRHNRLDRRGSQFDTSLEVSRRTQSWDTFYRWFMWSSSRFHLKPRLLLTHEDERHYQGTSTKVQLGSVMTFDALDGLWSLEAGPAWEQTRTFRGSGAPKSNSLLMEGFTGFETHRFEFYRSSPREGGNIGLSLVAADESFQSTYSATKVTLTGELLKNIGPYDPPFAVLGLRWSLAQTQASGDAIGELPNRMLHYMGGSTNLRGFDRQELPLNGIPQRSSGYLGLEVRHSPAHYRDLQPLAFVDAAKLGVGSNKFDDPLYWSPGAGLRWETMFGVIRLTLAHGYIANSGDLDQEDIDHHTHWQFYFSFGEEF
jgi:outer membrane protein assembly factor BamA